MEVTGKKLKMWKTFDKKFSKYIGDLLWKYHSQCGIPPEFLLDYILQDNKRIRAIVVEYYMQSTPKDDKQREEKKSLIIREVEKMSNVQLGSIKHILTLVLENAVI